MASDNVIKYLHYDILYYIVSYITNVPFWCEHRAVFMRASSLSINSISQISIIKSENHWHDPQAPFLMTSQLVNTPAAESLLLPQGKRQPCTARLANPWLGFSLKFIQLCIRVQLQPAHPATYLSILVSRFAKCSSWETCSECICRCCAIGSWASCGFWAAPRATAFSWRLGLYTSVKYYWSWLFLNGYRHYLYTSCIMQTVWSIINPALRGTLIDQWKLESW